MTHLFGLKLGRQLILPYSDPDYPVTKINSLGFFAWQAKLPNRAPTKQLSDLSRARNEVLIPGQVVD
jgi:hypothetical protein